ncbi:hypothetical protein M2103_001458 [Ereboglobus sp. PH5-5]|uniref:cell division protein FtsQ/DivIB n=1 Tax=Ereboglobus sp. PH5-5 TaxID=2940529 RepID=UPI002406646D|nr:FtsQ-type POTRA domain-containing protein [Ereboglobus sp. PH5-5]MDF9833235.1 hypothetical protein [Ereboglobus sp. PH5-5]
MKHSPNPSSRSPNNWRNLTRQVTPGVRTPISQKRQKRDMIKKIALCLLLCVMAIIAFEVYTVWKNNPSDIKAPVKDTPLKTITVRSNGVLDYNWTVRTLALPEGVDMMELDITALRKRILDHAQVHTAVLTRQFPDTLTVTLEERSPVARILIQQPGGEREELLVATDGIVYSGANYAPGTLAALPYLADVNLLRTAPGAHQYLPLAGIDFVAKLVAEAQINIPDHYATWRSISMKRYDEDRLLVVNTSNAARITFGIREEFINQIARLDYILNDIARTANPNRGPVHTIDLSVGQTASGIQAPVTFHRK